MRPSRAGGGPTRETAPTLDDMHMIPPDFRVEIVIAAADRAAV
jgi:hypothetical protein